MHSPKVGIPYSSSHVLSRAIKDRAYKMSARPRFPVDLLNITDPKDGAVKSFELLGLLLLHLLRTIDIGHLRDVCDDICIF